MANIYVPAAGGNNANNGSTWALGKETPAGADAIDAAGDNIYLSSNYSESNSTNLTLNFAGTLTAPTNLFSVNDSAEPPTTLAAGATITKTGGASITINGSLYSHGINFISNASLGFNTGTTTGRCIQIFENCSLRSDGAFNMSGVTDASTIELRNCTIRFNGTGNYINVGHRIRISGGSIVSGSATPVNLFYPGQNGRGGLIEVEGFDFSNFGSTFNFFQAANLSWSGKHIVRNCKLPASWSGSLINGTITGIGARVEMHNCDSGDTNYRFRCQDYAGQINSETTIYRTGGASDGTTPISWRMASNANTLFPCVPLESPELPAWWNDDVGSSKTVTVEIVHDGASALTDGEIWLEVQYLGTSGFPLSLFVSDRKTLLAAGAAQATSSAAWAGDTGTGPNGSATWNTLKLECTFTPQEAGYIQARVFLTKPSTTVFVDPKMTVA